MQHKLNVQFKKAISGWYQKELLVLFPIENLKLAAWMELLLYGRHKNTDSEENIEQTPVGLIMSSLKEIRPGFLQSWSTFQLFLKNMGR